MASPPKRPHRYRKSSERTNSFSWETENDGEHLSPAQPRRKKPPNLHLKTCLSNESVVLTSYSQSTDGDLSPAALGDGLDGMRLERSNSGDVSRDFSSPVVRRKMRNSGFNRLERTVSLWSRVRKSHTEYLECRAHPKKSLGALFAFLALILLAVGFGFLGFRHAFKNSEHASSPAAIDNEPLSESPNNRYSVPSLITNSGRTRLHNSSTVTPGQEVSDWSTTQKSADVIPSVKTLVHSKSIILDALSRSLTPQLESTTAR